MMGRGVALVVSVLVVAGCTDDQRAPNEPHPTGSLQPTVTPRPAVSPRPTASPPVPDPSSWPTSSSTVRPPAGRSVLDIVTQVGEQCPHRPPTYDPRCAPVPRPDTGYAVLDADGKVIARGRSGADGHAQQVVSPGRYVVRGEPVTGYQLTPEREVSVELGAAALVPLTYATGIQ